MTESEPLDRTRRDYDRIAEAYDEFVRHGIDAVTDALSTAMIDAFAGLIPAGDPAGDPASEVVDAGCGPGLWAEHLDRRGLRVSGIDLSPAMIAIARRYRPDLRYEVGSLLDLAAADGSVAGVLSHFSLIHTPPPLVPRVLAEFARVLRPGGVVLVGVQVSDSPGPNGWLPYAHRASPAYLWSLDALAELMRGHAFSELGRLRVAAAAVGRPPGGYLLMRRGG